MAIENDRQLAQLSHLDSMLARATKVEEVTDIRDKLRALEVYAKNIKASIEETNQYTAARIRSERKAGQLIPTQIKTGRPQKELPGVTLSDLNISKRDSSKWQALARMADDIFNAEMQKCFKYNIEMSTQYFVDMMDIDSHQLIHQSKSNEWYTPLEYIEAARAVMGSIDLDPASNEYANKTIMAGKYYTKEEDGLTAHWFGNIWLNPPYGKANNEGSNQAVWSERLIDEYDDESIEQAILLVNAVPGNLWFYPLWDYVICFPRQRIKFYNKKSSTPAPTHGNALVYFGDNVQKFANEFEQFGAIVTRFNNG